MNASPWSLIMVGSLFGAFIGIGVSSVFWWRATARLIRELQAGRDELTDMMVKAGEEHQAALLGVVVEVTKPYVQALCNSATHEEEAIKHKKMLAFLSLMKSLSNIEVPLKDRMESFTGLDVAAYFTVQ